MTEKQLAICVAGLGTIAVAYGIRRLLQKLFPDDEYFTTLNWQGGATQRCILVLGLEGAGKTRLVECFQQPSYPGNILPTPSPTIGYNIHSIGIQGVDYHFWEGGRSIEQPTRYFGIPNHINVLTWVVDSSRPESFPASRTSLHEFLHTCDSMSITESSNNPHRESLNGIPVVIVASKQDVPNCVSSAEVLREMDLDSVQDKHNVYVVGTQLPGTGHRHGLWRLYELLAFAEHKTYRAHDSSYLC